MCVKNWHARQFTPQNLLPLVDVEMMLLVETDCEDAMLRMLKPSILHLLNAPRITDLGLNLFIKVFSLVLSQYHYLLGLVEWRAFVD